MSVQAEERLGEIFKWYEYNKSSIPPQDVVKKIMFLEKTIDCLFELICLQMEATQALEHKGGMRSRKLWLPNGVEINGDLTKFG